VPGGPRVRVRTSPAGDTEIQIASGSAVIVPKTEEQELDISTLPIEQLGGVSHDQVEEGDITGKHNDERHNDITNSVDIKLEANTNDPTELEEDWRNRFARLIAHHHTASRRSNSNIGRQEAFGGPVRGRSGLGPATTSRNRSRNPTRARTAVERSPQRHSQMFFSEVRGSHDSEVATIDAASEGHSHGGTPAGDSPSPSGSDEPTGQCQCAVSYVCVHRRANLLDCRPLVREWVSKKDRQDQEAFDRQVYAWLGGSY